MFGSFFMMPVLVNLLSFRIHFLEQFFLTVFVRYTTNCAAHPAATVNVVEKIPNTVFAAHLPGTFRMSLVFQITSALNFALY
jgi:hypothetical protein